MLAEPGIIGINFGDPKKHDMDAVLSHLEKIGKIYYGHCGQREDENRRDYFRRVKRGRGSLLLQYYCTAGEQDDVLYDWDDA
jgi:hypothetical protein